MVPTRETVLEAYPQQIDTAKDPRIIHDNLPRNLFVIIQLLSVLVLPGPKEQSASTNKSSNRVDDMLAVDSLSIIWFCVSAEELGLLERSLRGSYPTLLSILRTCISRLHALKFEAITCSRATILLCQWIEFFLCSSFDSPDRSLEKAICWAIADVIYVGQKNPEVMQIYNDNLRPIIQTVQEKPDALDRYAHDLKVSRFPISLSHRLTPESRPS